MEKYNKETFINMLDQIPYTLTKKTKKNPAYVNLPMSFDTETSSFYDAGQKRAIMYVWMFAVRGYAVYGRTWDEFEEMLCCIHDYYELSNDRNVLVYVHNLAFDFAFFCRRIKWASVFALDDRKPVSARSEIGIEFRCSMILSGYSLAKVAENLHSHDIRKLVGDLDYTVLRTPETPLSETELMYCENDVLIVTAYISECIDDEGGMISSIPLTQTGYVRRYVREECLPKLDKKAFFKYHDFIRDLTLTIEEYNICRDCFAGGFVHANPYLSTEILLNVGSIDETSAYPYAMCSEMFPCGKMRYVEIENMEQLTHYMQYYCVIMEVYFTEINESFVYDHYISASKCKVLKGEKVDNGRVVYAEKLLITITNVDFEIIQKTYTWSKLQIGKCYIMEKAYLPRPIINAILDFYEKKTTLKQVPGKEIEYLHAKGNLNSIFGMAVTSVIRDEIGFNNETGWTIEEADGEDQIAKHNKSYQRFLYYPWGVFVTAYSRRNIWEGILEFSEDYAYSDTDSIKGMNFDRHRAWIESYNKRCAQKLRTMCRARHIDFAKTHPKTIKGVEKPLGVWDFEGYYDRFKTCGAKRYMTEVDGKIGITVAGLSKKAAVYICEGWSYSLDGKREYNSPFRKFRDGMEVEEGKTGRLTHTYIDDPIEGTCRDYKGSMYNYKELSCVHLEASRYVMSLSQEYAEYIAEKVAEKIKEGKRNDRKKT